MPTNYIGIENLITGKTEPYVINPNLNIRDQLAEKVVINDDSTQDFYNGSVGKEIIDGMLNGQDLKDEVNKNRDYTNEQKFGRKVVEIPTNINTNGFM
jgi:hypothetical protein